MKTIRLLFALLLILSIGACSDFYLTFTEETGGGANSEASADAEALDASDFTFTGSESAGTVESDFTLPTSGESGNTTITWASDAPYVSISGGSATVVAPAGTDTVVTLTAIITDGDGNTATKEITVTVLAITEAQAVTNVINWLWYEDGDGLHSNAITLTGGDIDELQISQDFTLTVTDPWYGSTIAWTSDNAAVAITGANAVVTAPLTGTIGVNLNTTVTIGAASQSFSATPYGEMSIQIQGSSFSPIIDTGNTAGTSFVFDNMVLDSSGRAIISGRSGGAVQVYADNGSGDWAALGNPSANTGDKVSMTIDGSDHVYIAYTDSDNSNAVYVQEWDGASWTVLGGGAVSDVNALYPHVINSPLSDGQLWLTYNESDDFISVQTWTGAAWSTNINTVSGIDINSSLGAGPGQFRPRVWPNASYLYVASVDINDNYVDVWRTDGTAAWAMVGDWASEIGETVGINSYIEFTIFDGTPIIGYLPATGTPKVAQFGGTIFSQYLDTSSLEAFDPDYLGIYTALQMKTFGSYIFLNYIGGNGTVGNPESSRMYRYDAIGGWETLQEQYTNDLPGEWTAMAANADGVQQVIRGQNVNNEGDNFTKLYEFTY